jgi:hypothetical protein
LIVFLVSAAKSDFSPAVISDEDEDKGEAGIGG